MPFFSSSSPFDAAVEQATDEMNVEDNWALILDICDQAKRSQSACKDCLRSIMKRLRHRVPYVSLQALTLLNACVKNCGHAFHLEIASRDFVSECRSLLNDRQTHVKVAQSLRMLIKAWSEGEFKSDSALSLIPSLYSSLKSEGHSFTPDDTPKSKTALSRDQAYPAGHSEEEDFVKAIAMSLRDVAENKSKADVPSTSLYPSFNSAFQAAAPSPKVRDPRKVRALYDFEAAEDNELTFKAGEIIGVLDDSDSNWWKGVSWRGEGLFPANFVTSDLSVDPTVGTEPVLEAQKTVDPPAMPLKVDEEKIDQTLVMIQNADPTAEDSDDPPEMAVLEATCRSMGPLIDQELEKIDRLHGQLVELNGRLMESLQLYHNLMQELPQHVGQTSYTTVPQFISQPNAMTQVPLVDATFSGQTTNQFNYGVPQMSNSFVGPSATQFGTNIPELQPSYTEDASGTAGYGGLNQSQQLI